MPGFKCFCWFDFFFFFLYVVGRATTENLVVAPTRQKPQMKLRHMVDSLEHIFYKKMSSSKLETKIKGKERSVLQGCILDISLCWRHGGHLCQKLVWLHDGRGWSIRWSDTLCSIQWSDTLCFSTALGCIVPCPVLAAVILPGRWGRLTSFHFFSSRHFGNPQSWCWSLCMLVNLTCTADTSSKFIPACGSSDIVCVEEARRAAELLQVFCQAQGTLGAALSA